MTSYVKMMLRKGVIVSQADVYVGNTCKRKGWNLDRSKWWHSCVRQCAKERNFDLYREHIVQNMQDQLCELKGKTIGCFCKTVDKCHANILIELCKEHTRLREPTLDSVEPTPDSVEPTPDFVEPTPDSVESTPDFVEPTPDSVGLPANLAQPFTVTTMDGRVILIEKYAAFLDQPKKNDDKPKGPYKKLALEQVRKLYKTDNPFGWSFEKYCDIRAFERYIETPMNYTSYLDKKI